MINKMKGEWVELYCESTGELITRRRSQGNDGVAGWEVDRHNEQCKCYRSFVVDNDYEPPTNKVTYLVGDQYSGQEGLTSVEYGRDYEEGN